jgi:hypothetical protein
MPSEFKPMAARADRRTDNTEVALLLAAAAVRLAEGRYTFMTAAQDDL